MYSIHYIIEMMSDMVAADDVKQMRRLLSRNEQSKVIIMVGVGHRG